MVVIPGVAPIASSTTLPFFFVALQQRTIAGTLYGSINPRMDLPKLVDLYMAGALKVDQMITRYIRLDDINEAFEALKKRQIVGRWVVVME